MTEPLRLTIGTAGHVDHGKTSLVRALTGIETDRWAEEKRRGMTIDLGFAHLELPGGRRAAVVDVPGHERFLRNMLAGASGLDLVLLVVAADDGVMPQTREHLDILELLAVRAGLVVLTKIDLVDPELRALAEADIREQLADTFLADAPILPVSSVTGDGIPALLAAIDALTATVPARAVDQPPRMAVDRVFVRPGFGTVVTGTMLSGRWQEGDKVGIWPGDLTARIRGLQVHGDKVSLAEAGQRVALNLAGVERAALERGVVVGAPGRLRSSQRIAVDLTLLKDPEVALRHRDRIRFYLGTAEVMGRVIPLETDVLGPGDRGLAIIELEDPVAVDYGDRFVLRRFSPMATLGGGRVVHPQAPRFRRHRQGAALLHPYAAEDWAAVLRQMATQTISPLDRTAVLADLPPAAQTAWAAMIDSGELIAMGTLGYFHGDRLQQALAAVEQASRDFLARHAWRAGAPRETLIGAVNGSAALLDHLLERLAQAGQIVVTGALVVPQGWSVVPGALGPQGPALLARIDQEGLIDRDDLIKLFPDLASRIAEYLTDRVQVGQLIGVSREIYATRQACEALTRALKTAFPEPFTASQARESLGLSRRFAIPFLEYCDSQGLTRRQGDQRELV